MDSNRIFVHEGGEWKRSSRASGRLSIASYIKVGLSLLDSYADYSTSRQILAERTQPILR